MEPAQEILSRLAELSTEARREGTKRYVKTDLEVIGVTAPQVRGLAKEYGRLLETEPAARLLELARTLVASGRLEARLVAYLLLVRREEALAALSAAEIERLGEGNDNWGSVDGLACELVGPCWLTGIIADEAVMRWARSSDLWWQRTAIVATTGLNKKSRGGVGDPARTLEIVGLFVEDRRPMISKAVSWALRELGKRCPKEVMGFLDEHEGLMPGHVEREVWAKLKTGRKDGKRRV